MLRKIINLVLKKKNKNREDICNHCIWHKGEDDYNKPHKNGVHYCSLNDTYTSNYSSCDRFQEERFEATEDSTTLEANIDLEFSAQEIADAAERKED